MTIFTLEAILLAFGGVAYYLGVEFDANYLYGLGNFSVLVSTGIVAAALLLVTYIFMSMTGSDKVVE